MPCLNEAETIRTCVEKAQRFIAEAGVSAEVLIADNGSTDGSQAIAEGVGARVVPVAQRGYGAALSAGIAAARGRYVVMGDADDSYDFSVLGGFLEQLRAGKDLVMGNRFAGGIEEGAMPFLHKYLGNPVLSFLGRLFFKAPVRDFHCGLRGFRRDAILSLGLETHGMEFASEMVVKAALRGLQIGEVAVRLAPDGRSRPPHLRTWRDGWRHLKFLLIYSPRWLFFYPGMLLFVAGLVCMLMLWWHPVSLGSMGFDIHTMAYAGAAVVLGLQMQIFGLFARLIGQHSGWLPQNDRLLRLLGYFSIERGLIMACMLGATGIALSLFAVYEWATVSFGPLDPRNTMRIVIPSVTLVSVSGEIFLASFLLEALKVGKAIKAK